MISGPTGWRRTARCWRRFCATTTRRACRHASSRRKSCSTPRRTRALRVDLARGAPAARRPFEARPQQRLLLSRRNLNELVELLLCQRLADEFEVYRFLHQAIEALDRIGIDQALG